MEQVPGSIYNKEQNGYAHPECGRVVVSHNVQRDSGAKDVTMVHAQGSLDTLG